MVDIIIGFPGSDARDGPYNPGHPIPEGPSQQHPNPHGHHKSGTTCTANPHYSEWRKYFPVASVFYELAKSLSREELCSMAALGVLVAGPPAVKGVAGAFMGLMEYGPIFNSAALEILANEAMLSAFTRAGVLGALKPGTTSIYDFSGHMLFKFADRTAKMTRERIRVLEHMGVEGVINEAVKKGLETPHGGLLLWSGFGIKGVEISKEFARKAGYTTLEMTPGGMWLDGLKLWDHHSPFSDRERDYIWKKVSEIMISKASGQVSSVVGHIHPNSAYNAELRAIKDNPKILGIEELQLLPRIFMP